MQDGAHAASAADPTERFEGCVRPLLSGLRSAALRLTRRPEDADDLLQETVLRAWRFWTHYAPGSNLRAWLHRILLNTFVNGYRRARREREVMAQLRDVTELLAPNAIEPQPLLTSVGDEVADGLAELPADFREVLWAVAVDELSYREAAESLGCPIGTVMSRLHRARHAMQCSLAPYALANGYS
jgi:RNA polymerase sigma-70 factor (ECF subfamily)